MNPTEFREGEYVVVGTTIIDMPPFVTDQDGNLRIISINLKELEVKTYVEDYNKARYRLLAVAEKVRNYAAYVIKARLPLTFDMVGKRLDTGQWLLPLAVFDGTTHLPITDGGVRDISVFRTRFGSHDGVKPPFEALENLENLKTWVKELNMKLDRTQKLLDGIKDGIPLDMAISSLGESIWSEGAKERLTNRWRAIETIAKIDYRVPRIKPYMLFETLRRRAKGPLEVGQFERLRLLRNVSTHSVPPQEQTEDVHQAADELFRLAYEIVESALREAGFAFP
jgi:hypothetical protein